MRQTYARGLLDRYDGWRVKDVDPLFSVIPFIMRTRLDSQNYFEETIPIETIEAFIRDQKEALPDLTFMHVIMAGMVRMLALRPYLNRFVVWNKIYARNHISISLMIKRSFETRGEETMIKPEFDPRDTIGDVVAKVKAELDRTQAVGETNATDKLARVLRYMPAFAMRFLVGLVRRLDNVGLLPRFIHALSPFHCSGFLTNLGSLGINSAYHHLYEFGTCSMFVAMGKKMRVHTLAPSGVRSVQRLLGLKFVADERICDGHYYATSIKMFRRLLMNPEQLLTPPERVIADDGVGRPPLGG